MITFDQLEAMPPGHVFARGVALDEPGGIHLTGSGRVLGWVAVRGDIPDWAIYCHWFERGWDFIRTNGDKIHNADIIARLVPCDDATFARYRP